MQALAPRPVRRLAALALMLLAASQAPPALAVDAVQVTNFPAVQAVAGKVDVAGSITIDGHPRSTSFVSFEEQLVAPIGPGARIRDWVPLGVIDATGHATMIATIGAWVPLGAGGGGTLELLLVPDVELVRDALERDDETAMAIRVSANLAGLAGRTASTTSPKHLLAFPRWRAYIKTDGIAALRAHVFFMLGD